MEILNMLLLISFLIIILFILIIAVYSSLLERLLLAVFQNRLGPSLIGWNGPLQPWADFLKLLHKSFNRNLRYESKLLLVPILITILPLLSVLLLPYGGCKLVLIPYDSLLFFTLLSCTSVPFFILIIGSESKIVYLSIIRNICITSSYGVSFLLILIIPLIFVRYSSLCNISLDYNYCYIACLPIIPIIIIVVITKLHKVPFDITESEAELASGYLIEFSGMYLGLVIISGYMENIIICLLLVALYLPSYSILIQTFFLILLILIFYILRSFLPNIRFDTLILLHWMYIFPYILFIIIISSIILL